MIAEKFLELDSKRQGLLRRARECAKLTIPSVLPPEGYTENDVLPTPYQSIGAQGVNQLVSKLLMVLAPANVPFFKLSISPTILKALNMSSEETSEILTLIEKRIVTYLDELNLREALAAALRDLIVTGNALLYFGRENIKTYRLNNFVVQRDAAGNVIRIITREGLSWESLPEELKQALKRNKDFDINEPSEYYQNQGVTLWTMAEWTGKDWRVTQEVDKYRVKQVTFQKKNFPFIVLRWSQIPGEDYGRGLIEQYLGDLKTLEALYEALVTGALQSARVIWLVRPTSVLTPKDIQDAWNGEVKVGNPEDVGAVQLQKYADFQWIYNLAAQLEQRLAQVFFLIPSSIRNAERVTAEEVRLVSQELETGLGGVYTLLTNELQRPMLYLILNRLAEKGEMLDIDKFKDILEVKIITGFAGLGRTEDFNRLLMFSQSVVGLPNAATYLNTEKVMKQMAISLGVDPNIVRSDQEVQALMMQQMQQQAIPQLLAQAMSQQQMMGGAENAPQETENA